MKTEPSPMPKREHVQGGEDRRQTHGRTVTGPRAVASRNRVC